MAEKILTLGLPFDASGFEEIGVCEKPWLVDGDVTLISINGLEAQILNEKQIEASVYTAAQHLAHALDVAIQEALDHGRLVVLFPSRNEHWKVRTKPPLRNPFLRLVPKGFKLEFVTGTNLEFVENAGEYFAENSELSDNLRYYATFLKYRGEALLRVCKSDTIAGVFTRVGRGAIAILPEPKGPPGGVRSVQDAGRMIKFLVGLLEKINKGGDPYEVESPDWAKMLQSSAASKCISNLVKAQSQFDKATATLEKTKRDLRQIEQQKVLFFGKGDSLEVQVRAAFEQLGFKIVDSWNGDADLVMEDSNGRFVVEVKGTKKSAAQKHARQLVQWKMEETGNDDLEPKGILVVNAFCENPLTERTEQAFPDNVGQLLAKHEMLGLTGFQLFGLMQAATSKKEKARLRKLLASSTGVLEGHDDIAELFVETAAE